MAKFFQATEHKGELKEINDDLNSKTFEIKKNAVKRVIAYMTVGKDVSPLFQSVIKCLEHPEIELKKLVYLYIINYSRYKPDDAIMVVNLFRKDIENGTPLIRALAVRTMGCLRVPLLNDYLGEPLKNALQDRDSYVKKTAALCVPKVYEVSPKVVEDWSLVKILLNMIEKEGNSLVLANVITALWELREMKCEFQFEMNTQILNRLLVAVNDCLEWGQVFILDRIYEYEASGHQEAERIIDKVLPRLGHNNSAVVFSAAKLLLRLSEKIKSSDFLKSLGKKIATALVSLISNNPPEIVYTMLRNVYFIIEKYPAIMEKEFRSFYCKYNDPFYVKAEKLELLMLLLDNKNYEIILNELTVYLHEIDPEFIRKCIRYISIIAMCNPKAVDKVIVILLKEFKHAKENSILYVLNEIVIVFKNILRKYPLKWCFENCLYEICRENEVYNEPEARASFFWMLGEFCPDITSPWEILKARAEKFLSEERTCQLQILTCAVKIYLTHVEETTDCIHMLLLLATEKCISQDIRERAWVYWRMLSIDPELTRKLIYSKKTEISIEKKRFDNVFVEEMIPHLSMTSSVFHKLHPALREKHDKEKREHKTEASETKFNNEAAEENNKKKLPAAPDTHNERKTQRTAELLVDTTNSSTPTQRSPNLAKNVDLLDLGSNDSVDYKLCGVKQVELQEVVSEDKTGTGGCSGLLIKARFTRENDQIYLEMNITNKAPINLKKIEVQLFPNHFGLKIVNLNDCFLEVDRSSQFKYNIVSNDLQSCSHSPPSLPLMLTASLKCELDEFCFYIPMMFHILLSNAGELNREYFKNLWKSIPPNNSEKYKDLSLSFEEEITKVLRRNSIFFIYETESEGKRILYFSAKSVNEVFLLLEVAIFGGSQNPPSYTITSKSMNFQLTSLFLQTVFFLLS